MITVNNENIAGMINLDMILRPGWDDDPMQPEDLDIGTVDTTLCFDWANTFITAANNFMLSISFDTSTPYTDNWDSGDQGPFIKAGFPAFMVAENTVGEIWSGNNAYYHSPEDASNGLTNDPFCPSGVTYDYAFATDVVRTAVATVAVEAVFIPEPAVLLLIVFGTFFKKKNLNFQRRLGG